MGIVLNKSIVGSYPTNFYLVCCRAITSTYEDIISNDVVVTIYEKEKISTPIDNVQSFKYIVTRATRLYTKIEEDGFTIRVAVTININTIRNQD